MKFCVNTINQLVEILQTGHLPYKDTIIIGDNSSGKSLLIRQLIEKTENKKEAYFIDAVNRVFDVAKITKTIERPEYKKRLSKPEFMIYILIFRILLIVMER